MVYCASRKGSPCKTRYPRFCVCAILYFIFVRSKGDICSVFILHFLLRIVTRGSTTFYFLNGLTRFLCKNLCKKARPILFFYSIKFRGYAHYANAMHKFYAPHTGLPFENRLCAFVSKVYFSLFAFRCFCGL